MFFLLNNVFVNCNEYIFYYFTRIVGTSSIYYRKLYNYITINNTYTITKIIIDNEQSSNISLYPTINFNNLLEVKYNLNNKDYWIQYNSNNKIEKFLFPIYDDISSGAFKETDDNIILVSLDQENINNDDLLTIIKELSGPKGNFYKDIGYIITKNNILSLINRELGINIKNTNNIEIMYSSGEIILI